ncbi:alpha/beta-hydrolase [Ascodesmis nigricans]|uniref:Alpha/beta-hydrolase n=1 Tax=Ascodesmis nigricans TaxID=341454 RepID=A0A4V3SHY3_9PEZI|nr:alpha/beta-hydrolase [Ascodesmis nigricans]
MSADVPLPADIRHEGSSSVLSALLTAITPPIDAAARALESKYPNLSWLPENRHREIIAAAAVCSAIPMWLCCRSVSKKWRRKSGRGEKDADSASCRTSASSDALATEPTLLRRHSRTISVTTDHFTYPAVRVFYRSHPKADVLPPKLPLIVFVHGLGGQIQQFQYLLDYFIHISHVLAIDLPGCGGSEFAPKVWSAYTTQSLCEVIYKVVEEFREENQQVILVGHSMGCALSATLITKGGLMESIAAGFVAISPKAILTEKEAKQAASISSLPEFMFDLFRMLDRRGGTKSKSVSRFVGKNAPESVKRLQLRFNEGSRTPVWLRMVNGIQLPTREQWTSIRAPILLLGAIEDKVTTMWDLDEIHSWFDPSKNPLRPASSSIISSSTSSDDGSELSSGPPTTSIKKCIVPGAGHALIYEAHQVVCGLIGEFLSKHVDEILSLGWQLSYLKEDKWMLKNLKKWESIQAVSPRIIGRIKDPKTGLKVEKATPFRAMKTLRQNDQNGHNPIDFSQNYGDVGHVIDISHEQPPYDPETFGSDIVYHKYATVSKIPPTKNEVRGFITLIDSILSSNPSNPSSPTTHQTHNLIAVHCHYGFNRTGFLLCCYMIERLGFSVPEAIAAFKEARPPGIRHPHFVSEMFERYCVGLLRAPTF